MKVKKAKSLRVNVTKDDIESGEPESYDSCPIAIALREEYGSGERNSVGVTQKYAIIGRLIYKLPPIAREFIKNFDKKRKVKPFSFNLKEAP